MRALALAAALLAPLLAVWAPPQPAQAASEAKVAEIVFDAVARRLIHEYYGVPYHGGKPGKVKGGPPPGLAKKASLPPGLQRQLDERGRLPPGLRGRGLPGDLESRLPHLPAGYRRVIVDHDVLLIEAATGVILDVIFDVVREHRRGG